MAQQRLKFRYLNRCDIYVFLWALYSLQNTFYESGIINQALQLIMILWCFVVALRYILLYKTAPKLLNATSLLVLMYTVYGIVYMLLGQQLIVVENSYQVAKYLYLQDSFRSLLPIYLFYHYSRTGKLTESRLKVYFFLFVLVSISNFNKYQATMAAQDIWGNTQFTNNVAYSFLALFPMVCFFYKKPLLEYAMATLLMVYIIMGMKRGAIAIAALCFAYFLWKNLRNTKSVKLKVAIYTLSAILIGIGIWYVMQMMATNEWFMMRIQSTREGDSSGRDKLYGTLLYELRYNYSVRDILIGRGANSTVAIAGNYAHQDWLETMCNNGILGIVLLLIFYGRFLATALRSRKLLNPSYSTAFITLFIICLFRTMFSMSIQSMGMSTTMLLGYLVFQVSSNNEKDETASVHR